MLAVFSIKYYIFDSQEQKNAKLHLFCEAEMISVQLSQIIHISDYLRNY